MTPHKRLTCQRKDYPTIYLTQGSGLGRLGSWLVVIVLPPFLLRFLAVQFLDQFPEALGGI